MHRHEKLIYGLFSLLMGVLILLHVSNYQALLSQGDHGRDLYAFERALKGDLPYQDYWWVYGPLMPYYYGFFMLVFGASLQSVLIGKIILILASSIFFYLTICLFAPPLMAFLATGWLFLFNPDFFFTYNHTAGFTLIFAIIFLLCRYLKDQEPRWLLYLGISLFTLCLIKINFGVFALAGSVLSVLVIDKTLVPAKSRSKHPYFYPLTLIGLPLVTFGIYYGLLHPMPLYAVRQCLPYLAEDHPYNSPLWISFLNIARSILDNMGASLPNLFFAFLVLLSLGQIVFLVFKKGPLRGPQNALPAWITRRHIMVLFGVFSLFYMLFLHEYLASGVLYRSFWAKPFCLALMFITIALGTANLTRSIRSLLHVTLAVIITLTAVNTLRAVTRAKTPWQFIPLKKARIYVGNTPAWIATVFHTTRYLQTQLSEDETFFAAPYDALYYFLTGKKSPTRQLIFFEHINIPPQQEQKIIKELEAQKVNWVVLSSRGQAAEPGLGTWGATYCPLLAEYVKDHFVLQAQIGDWVNEPLWAQHHGTKIYRRKDPLE